MTPSKIFQNSFDFIFEAIIEDFLNGTFFPEYTNFYIYMVTEFLL